MMFVKMVDLKHIAAFLQQSWLLFYMFSPMAKWTLNISPFQPGLLMTGTVLTGVFLILLSFEESDILPLLPFSQHSELQFLLMLRGQRERPGHWKEQYFPS